ncbi:MAG: CDP-glycerol glycerophosphotransferase family protein [Candidatus Hermodarchaeota archaeon]
MNPLLVTKKVVHSILNLLITFIGFLLPLDFQTIILANYGRPYLDANNYFFLRYLENRWRERKEIPYIFYMITSNPKKNGNLSPTSLRDLFVILRCKTFFITHGNGDYFWTLLGKDPRRLIIDFAHGTPVKNIATSLIQYKERKYKLELYNKDSVLRKRTKLKPKEEVRFLKDWPPSQMRRIVSSKLDQYLMAASIPLPIEQCIPIGSPSNDLFFTDSLMDKRWERRIQSLTEGFDKIILYAPTYRPDFIENPQFLPFLENYSVEHLEQVLKKYNAILLYRGHINTNISKEFNEKLKSPFIKNASFKKVFYVHYLLKYVDILITDYSGVVYDFLPLNRPVIAIAKDWKQYERVRGFYLHYDRTFPGPITMNFREFLLVLEEYLQNPNKDRQLRQFWCRLFRDFSDGKCAHRTYLLLRRLLNQK